MHVPSPSLSAVSCQVEDFLVHLIVMDDAIVHLSFDQSQHRKAREIMAGSFPHGRWENASHRAEIFCGQFAEYLKGGRRSFGPLPDSPFLSRGTDFQRRVWQAISAIPYGASRTYGELAIALGSRSLARAVGQACHRNPLALFIPCHRVVGATGPGGFAGGSFIKQRLLAIEQEGKEAGGGER